jgi:hypothetical protein
MIWMLLLLIANTYIAFKIGKYGQNTYAGFEWLFIFSFCFTPLVAFLVLYFSKKRTLKPPNLSSNRSGILFAICGLRAVFESANDILHKSDSFKNTIHNNLFFSTYIEIICSIILGIGLIASGAYISRQPMFRFEKLE